MNELTIQYWTKYLRDLKKQCKQTGFPFLLTLNDVNAILRDNCALTGVELNVNSADQGLRPVIILQDQMAMDGYSPGNIVIVSALASQAYYTFTKQQLLQLFQLKP